MKAKVLNVTTSTNRNIKDFVEEHKMVIAAIGGITVGIALAALLGNDKAKSLLHSLGRGIVNSSGKFLSDLGNYKPLLAPLFAKNDVQGL